MDYLETERLDLLKDQKLIDEYLSWVVKKDLNIDINVSNEYVAAHNIVSQKLILVKTFSDIILENPDLYLLLSSLIQDINTGSLTKSRIHYLLKIKTPSKLKLRVFLYMYIPDVLCLCFYIFINHHFQIIQIKRF